MTVEPKDTQTLSPPSEVVKALANLIIRINVIYGLDDEAESLAHGLLQGGRI